MTLVSRRHLIQEKEPFKATEQHLENKELHAEVILIQVCDLLRRRDANKFYHPSDHSYFWWRLKAAMQSNAE